MKALPRLLVVLVALGSIGAKDCAAVPDRPIGGYDPNSYCYTDPPVGCAAYCSARDTVAFTPACSHISGDELYFRFQDEVALRAHSAAAQGCISARGRI